MNKRISSETINELKDIPIQSVCDSLSLNYKGDCPSGHDSEGHNCFHTFPDTNTWNCFHCKDSGEKLRIDTIGLVETTLKVNFPEACKYLIEQFRPDLQDKFSGISAEELQKITEKRQKTEQVYKALNYATDYYNKKLWENKEAVNYLTGRGITEEFIRDNPYVKFGHAPLKQEDLKQELFSKFGEEVTLATGLFSKNESGFIYPTMKIWIKELKEEIPVITYSYQMGGQARYIIGRRFTPVMEGETRDHRFSKLKLKEDGIIKNEIFGMDSLSIKNPLFKKSVLIAEGLFDCILAIQDNIPCISPITVTFSDKQKTEMCKAVRKFETVYIVPDPDSPGEKGAVETAKQLIKDGKSVKVVTLPRIEGLEKFDLADYLKQYKIEDFLELPARGLLDFLIETVPENTEKTDLNKLFEDKDIIKTIHSMDAINQEHYRGILSKRFNLEMETVKSLLPVYPGQEEKKEQKKEKKTLLDYDLKEEDLNLPSEWLIPKILSPYTITMLFSRSGGGKSFFTLLLALYLLARNIIDTVIYLDNDNSKQALIGRKIGDIKKQFKERFIYVPSFKTDKDIMKVLLNDLRDKKYGHCLVIVDSIRNFMSGKNPNDDKDAISFMDDMKEIRGYDNTVIMLHHLNKSGQVKNNTSFGDYSDISYFMEANNDKKKKRIFAEFTCDPDKGCKDRIGARESFIATIDYDILQLIIGEAGINPEDFEFTSYVKELLKENGQLKQKEIISYVKEDLSIQSNAEIQALLSKYTGIIWKFTKGDKNSNIYSLIDSPLTKDNILYYKYI